MDIIGNDYETKRNLSFIRSNNKFYKKMIDALNILGFFDKKVEAEVFNVDKRLGKVDLSFTDNNGDMFIICSKSNNKNDLNIIRKLGDDIDESYDLSLLKKSEVNNDNIDLCRTDKVYNTKHGRLISDKRTFISLFLGNEAYQLLADFNHDIDIYNVVNEINKYDIKPTFKNFVDSLNSEITDDDLDHVIAFNAYKDYVKVGSIRMDNLTKGYSKVKK